MVTVLHHQTGLLLFWTSYNVVKLYHIRMVEHLLDYVLSFDLFWLDGKQDFYGYLSPVFFIISFEHMGVFSPSNFFGDGVILNMPMVNE